jgi:peptide/nickel transport system substrate-binding protein
MRVRPVAVLVLLCALFCSCKNTDTNRSAATKQPLVVLVSSDLATFDPQIPFEVDSNYVLGNIYDSLVEFDENFRLSPSLAKRWTNPDDRTWRFYLNEQAHFSDGSLLKASDIKFSIERLKSLHNSDLRGFVEHIKNIEIVNDDTIDIKTDTPFSILNHLVFIPIISEKHARAAGDRIAEHPVGTGAYKLISREKGRKITLALNEYYKPKPQVEKVEFVINSDVDNVLNTVLSRKPDVTLTLPFRKIEEFQRQNRPDLELIRSNGITVEYLIYNLKASIPGHKKNPLLDLNLRKALAESIDRDEMIRKVINGFGRPATQLIAPEIFGYDSTVRSPAFNPAEAKRLIEQSGYTGLELPIYTLKGRSYRLENLLIQYWNKIGIRSSLKIWSDATEMNEALNDGNFALALGGYLCTSGDAGELLTFGLHTRTDSAGYGKGNYADYSNGKVDRLIQENLRVLDPRKRLEMIQQVTKIVNSDLPYLPLLIYDDVYIVSKRIRWVPPVSGELKIRSITYR